MLGLLRGGVDARRDLQQRQLAGLIEVSPAEAGLHLAGWLPEGKDGRHCVGPPPEGWRRGPWEPLAASTREGELVFDPFCGSGTSGVGAKELGLFFVGAELEEESPFSRSGA